MNDIHSLKADRRMLSRPRVVVTPFHRAQLANAIFQLTFRKQLSLFDAEAAYGAFERDCAVGVWETGIPAQNVYATCVRLARIYCAVLGVRNLDTLHVTAALECKADRFWTFDRRQAQLAEAEGLSTAAQRPESEVLAAVLSS